MKRKHILLITADGQPGGGVTNVLQLCKGLANEEDWRVTLCSQTGSYAIERGKAFCETHEIDFFQSRFDPRVTWNLRQLVEKTKPDMIHCHGARAALPLVYALGRSGPPVIYTVHGFHFPQKLRFPRVGGKLAERHIARHAQKLIFVCDHDRAFAEQEGIGPDTASTTILHGIDVHDLPPKAGHAKPLVILLGRLIYQKRPEMLIKVADLLRNTGISFLYIGGGALQPSLAREVKRLNLEEIVTFSGSMPREDALQLAAAADVAVLPSRWEGFPVALLEILGMEIPVVASHVNGVPEIVEDGVNGFLMETPDPEAYAERIQRLMGDPAMRMKLGQQAREVVVTRFSESRMFSQHLEVYSEVAAEAIS